MVSGQLLLSLSLFYRIMTANFHVISGNVNVERVAGGRPNKIYLEINVGCFASFQQTID